MAKRSARPSLRDVGVRRIVTPAGPRYQDRTTGKLVKSSLVKSRITRAERGPTARRLPVMAPRPERARPPAPPLPSLPLQRLTPAQQRQLLRQPVERPTIREVRRFRGPDGRYVGQARAERLTPAQRKRAGIRVERYTKTKAGLKRLGKRAAPLLAALQEYEDADMEWRDIPDDTLKALSRLSLV